MAGKINMAEKTSIAARNKETHFMILNAF